MLEPLRYRRLDRALRLAEKINAKDLFMVCMCVHTCICVHVHVCVIVCVHACIVRMCTCTVCMCVCTCMCA